MKRIFTILLFTVWTCVAFSQTTKDSLAELQSLLDSIPDISLSELGIDTTAEIVPDTLHLFIPTYIASDTAYARTCLNQAIELIKVRNYTDAYAKADTAKHIYQMNIGYVSREVADCLHQMGRVKGNKSQFNDAILIYTKSCLIRIKKLGENNQAVSNSLNNIGINLNGIGENFKAVKFYQKTLKIRLYIVGSNNTDVANTYNNLGNAYNDMGEYDKAIANLLNALNVRIKVLGNNHYLVGQSYNNIGSYYNSLGDFDKAIEYYQKALSLQIKVLGLDHLEVGNTYNNLGVTYNSLGDFDKAIEYYQKALSLQIKVLGLDHLEVGNTYNNLGVTYNSLGDFDKAIELHQKSIEVKIKVLGNNHPKIADTYYNLGISHYLKSEYKKAIEYYKKAVNMRIEFFGNDHYLVGFTFSNLGNAYESMGEYDKGLEFKQKGMTILIKALGINHQNIGLSYSNIGNTFDSKGEFDKALEYKLKGLDIQIKALGINHPDVGRSFNNIGNTYNLKGDIDKAIEYAHKGLEVRINTLIKNHPDIGSSYGMLGHFYGNKGDFDKAIDLKEKGLDIQIKALGINHPAVGRSFNNIGASFFDKGEYNTAIEYGQKALDIFIKTFDLNHPEIRTLFFGIGITYQSKGEYDKAIKHFKKGLEFNIKSGLDYPEEFSTLKELSSIYQKLNQLDSSLYYIHQAISGIKAQMASNISSETKNLYQSQNIPVIESAIDVSLIKSKQDQHDSLKLITYEYTELAKASLLQSQIKQTDALTFADIPDSLLQKEYDLRIDINWREKQKQALLEKGKEETDPEVLRISSIIFDLKREQETLFETLEKDYPEYYRLKYDTKTISLEDTQQKLLKDGQTMLEYFVGDSSIFIFVVRPDTFDVVQVKKDFPLDSLVRQMQSGLFGYYGQSADKRSDGLYKQSIQDYSDASHQLYQRIVAPVEQLLTQDLIIVPDGVLGYVPFEALLKSKPEKVNQFGTYPYMINDHNIAYNYSATLWNEMKNKKHKKEPLKSLVAFAPFYQGSFEVLDSTINLVFDTLPDGRDTTIFQDVVTRKAYNPLPSSGIEAGSISKMYKGDYFVNTTATEQKFYDIAGDYRFIHLSTHGVADARQGDYSYLAFAEQKDSIENEFLYVRDIYNTQLNADLVFLSACETAQGELQRGEGIISLARAFAYAGAKSIITTLWQVDDAATKDISIDFYKNLKKGFTKDVALRQAKLRHIKSAKSAQKHPFFWAAMIGIGDMEIVKK